MRCLKCKRTRLLGNEQHVDVNVKALRKVDIFKISDLGKFDTERFGYR